MKFEKLYPRFPNLLVQRFFFILLLALVTAGCSHPIVQQSKQPSATPPSITAIPTPVPGKISVDPRAKLGRISPLVYGANVGPWQYITRSMRPYVMKAGFRLLRFPGGNWGDEYILTRKQLDDFISLCRELGAEPLVQVKLFQGEPEDAARLVRYANVERGYGIKYWNIGNEPDLYSAKRGESDYTIEHFNEDWKRFADAMHSVDPSIELVGPEISSYSARDQNGRSWMEEFLRVNGNRVDVVSFHWYPFGKPGATRDSLLSQPPEWDGVIDKLHEEIQKYTNKDIPIAVTEVNSDWSNAEGGPATPDSYYNALWWADVLGRLIRRQVLMVGEFSLSGAGGLGLLSIEGPRPTYYVYLLYKHFGDELIYASSPYPMIPAYASVDDRAKIHLLVVNKTDSLKRTPLEIKGLSGSIQAYYWQMTNDGIKTGRTTIVRSLDLPPYSATMFEFEPPQEK